MFSHQQTLSQYNMANVIIWLLLAFQAGSINTGGYLACHRFVSHVTGFGTLVGTDAASGNFTDAVGMGLVPVFFMFGAMISAFLVDRRLQTNRKPLYPIVMFLFFLVTLLVTFLGQNKFLGEFGGPFEDNDYFLLVALCLACGIQNATITSAFNTRIRTTHLTGITTDLGIGLIRVLTHKNYHGKHQHD